MSLLAILLVLGTTVAANPAHLKPGALTAHLGRTYLVEDILWVQYPLPSLAVIPDNLRIITVQLTAALSGLDQSAIVAINDLGRVGQAWNRASLSYARGNLFAHTIREVICIGD